MTRFMRFFADQATTRFAATVGFNVLFIGLVLTLRFSKPASFQRPTLSLPNVNDFSLVNWVAGRLAEVVALLLDLLSSLVTSVALVS